MDDATARALNALNLAFYREQAAAFSAKRERPWRGWQRLLEWIPKAPPPGGGDALSLLDVGCGNGRFGRFLAVHRALGRYVGLDASVPLLALAQVDPPPAARVEWVVGDFVGDEPEQALQGASVPGSGAEAEAGFAADGFDLVVLFGVLHGVPGRDRRHALLAAAARRLAPHGLLVFTCWRFDDDARLAARAVDRPRVPGVDPAQLAPEDHLLPWGPADDPGAPLRYACALGAEEQEALARRTGLARVATFREDGPTGDLNDYCVLRTTGTFVANGRAPR